MLAMKCNTPTLAFGNSENEDCSFYRLFDSTEELGDVDDGSPPLEDLLQDNDLGYFAGKSKDA